MTEQTSIRLVEPAAMDWDHFAYGSSCFDTARRELTSEVVGTIRIPQFLVLATLRGGAERLEVTAACGHRYRGPERVGVISLVPPNCERQLRLYGVNARWASLAIDAAHLSRAIDAIGSRPGSLRDAHCISNIQDHFLLSVLTELAGSYLEDGCIEEIYFDAMLVVVAHHLVKRHMGPIGPSKPARLALPRWQFKRIAEYVDAHLEQPIRISELAKLTGLSEGYFHRAFRRTAHATPLEFINRRRIQRAIRIWQEEPDATVIDVAARVGYTSPSYFTRLFRKFTGTNPLRYRLEI